jgi:predicted HicB family RNase H-like nuclease
MEEKKSKKRLVIEVDDRMHETIKDRANHRHVTIRKWVLRALLEAIKKEQQYESPSTNINNTPQCL